MNEKKTDKVYICGKVSDLPYAVYKKNFEIAENELRARGYTNIINPVTLCEEKGLTDWGECMLECLKELFPCSKIFVMNNWHTSTGARIEVVTAEAMKKEFLYEYMFY